MLTNREDIFVNHNEDGFRAASSVWFTIQSQDPIKDSEPRAVPDAREVTRD